MIVGDGKRLIKRCRNGDSCTSCDSLVVEWSVAIASTRVQFPVTAFFYPFILIIIISISTKSMHHFIYCSSPQNSSYSSSIKYAFLSPKPSTTSPTLTVQGYLCSSSYSLSLALLAVFLETFPLTS